MITLRKSKDRGYFDHGWLKTYHTFSFADYYDPNHTHFKTLRVINEDTVEPGQGFGTHSHNDMEIVTYILKGALEHKDSMGNTSVIRPGEVQRMSAGTGVTHSEFNSSKKESVHLLQIWIFPDQKGLKPGYEQKMFDAEGKRNHLRLIVSPNGAQGSVNIHQNAEIYDCQLEKGKSVSYDIKPERGAWIQVIQGEVKLGKETLKSGDGASIESEKSILLTASQDSEFLLFDVK